MDTSQQEATTDEENDPPNSPIDQEPESLQINPLPLRDAINHLNRDLQNFNNLHPTKPNPETEYLRRSRRIRHNLEEFNNTQEERRRKIKQPKEAHISVIPRRKEK